MIVGSVEPGCLFTQYFWVTRARKYDKNKQIMFFLCWEKMNLLPDKQLLINVPFQSTKYKMNEFCVDNKVKEIIGDVYCPTCRNEKCVYVSTNKTSSFHDCKKCKACCDVLNIPFKGQKPNVRLCGVDGTHCFAGKTSRDYQKQTSLFLQKFFHQSLSSTLEIEPQKA